MGATTSCSAGASSIFCVLFCRRGAWVDPARGIRVLASRRGLAGAVHKLGFGVVRGGAPLQGRGWREELLGSARALSTTKVWGPPPEGVEEVVGETVAEHPTPKSLFWLRRGALFALTPDLTPDFTSDFTPDFTSGFTRTLDVWLAPERTSQFRQRRKTEQTAYTQNCFG